MTFFKVYKMNNKQTLKMNYEFKNVLEKGKYFVSSQIIIYILETNNNYNRFGIAISSKICKAVGRNKLKRLIREAYNKMVFSNDKFYDIVILWNKKTDYNEASFNIIYDNMKEIFRKAGII